MIRIVPPGGHRGRAGKMPRCAVCGMHLALCLCDSLRPLELATRVLVIHSAREAPQTTNTGRLVPLLLTGSEVRVRALRGAPLVRADLEDPGRRPVLLFPGPGARVLTPDAGQRRPVTLVVPDGTWRAARRMVAREPALRELEAVRLPEGAPSRYRLRRHPDAHFLATLEAVARALGILEGRAVQARLEAVFELFVARTLWSRGRRGGGSGEIPALRATEDADPARARTGEPDAV